MTVTRPQADAHAHTRGRFGAAKAWTTVHPYRARILLCLTLFALVPLIRLYIHFAGSFPGDGYALRHFSTPWEDASVVQQVTGFIGALGTAVVAGPLVILSAAALWRHGYRCEAQGVLIACSVLIANALMKLIFGPTHDWVAWHRLGTNFPSGHTSFITAVIGYLGVIAWRRGQREIAFASAVTVVVAGPARIVAGNHIVGDVVGGYLLGAAFLVAALTWTQWRVEQLDRRRA